MAKTRLGSTRIMTSVEPGVIALTYTNQWSAFDRGSSPQEIPRIGAARCACAVRSFKLASADNRSTHFVRQADDMTIHVQEFLVPGHELLSGKVHGRVIPLEFLDRARAAGSLLRRLREGKITPESLGFPEGTEVKQGDKLPRPILECTTKFEPMDRHLSDTEAKELAGLDDTQWREVWELVVGINNMLEAGLSRVGFARYDGKKEVGLSRTGKMIAVDVFGTPDEDRILNAKTGDLHCKDLIRNYLESLDWYQLLVQAKKEHPDDKSRWPPYPVLPDWLTQLVSERYAQLTLFYAGERV